MNDRVDYDAVPEVRVRLVGESVNGEVAPVYVTREELFQAVKGIGGFVRKSYDPDYSTGGFEAVSVPDEGRYLIVRIP